tara:strand:+ start:472 stop:639 length:168 start_codon:yes stop_codon:yes gene_type:complete
MNLSKELTKNPDELSKDIYNIQHKDKNTLSTEWICRCMILVILNIPELKFKGMSI